MFTGIIEELGTVKSLDKAATITRLQIYAPQIALGIQNGQSICVNGVCLTVIEAKKDLLSFEVMSETLERTNLGLLQPNDNANLERSLGLDGRIDGHFVFGHVDGTGVISEKSRKDADTVIKTKCSPELLRYIALKGSVALDGVSLTVSALETDSFCVNLIPYTLENTTLGIKKEGGILNIECDILAKYIDRFLYQNRQSFSPTKITPSFLQEYGFL